MRRLLIGILLLIAAAGPVLAAEDGDILERVVILQRHGVRSPTKPPSAYARYSSEAWPDWPVAPGELTPHGAENIRLMAGWLRGYYAGFGLLPAEGCPAGSVSVWADGADQRTRDSGQAFLEGAFPGCGLTAAHGPAGERDPIFDGALSACPADPAAARAALAAALRGLDGRQDEIRQAKHALYDILVPPARRAPCRDDQGACALFGQEGVRETQNGAKLDGGLSTAASLAENLLLEYGQGMDPAQVGWGRATADQIAKVMLLHNLSAALGRRTAYIAAHNGAVLARTVLAALRGEGGGRLKVITGHDTNLSNLAGILGVSWSLPGQPDDTPPGGALSFELWRDRGGQRTVKLAFFYQTLEDMRAGANTPLGRVEIPLAGRYEDFVKQVESAIPAACRG